MLTWFINVHPPCQQQAEMFGLHAKEMEAVTFDNSILPLVGIFKGGAGGGFKAVEHTNMPISSVAFREELGLPPVPVADPAGEGLEQEEALPHRSEEL